MNLRYGRQDAKPLELLPLDAYPAPAAPTPASARAVERDARSIRNDYLRARFPGVIRGAEDLEDTLRMADAIHCYLLDGRDDRAAELRELAGLAAPGQDEAAVRRGPDHAASIHRWFVR